MLCNLKSIPIRLVVTGSRGKSSLTRLLHAGFVGCGLRSYARVTGVLPRALAPNEERPIRRSSPANVREMHWWLSQIPPDAQALVVENSAVSPDLQAYAADRVSPTLAVWTNVRPDHTEVWGRGREGAAKTLIRGIPRGVPVAGGPELGVTPLPQMLQQNGNLLRTAPPSEDEPRLSGIADLLPHNADNLALAILVCEMCAASEPQVTLSQALPAMAALAPDIADFRILREGSDSLAVAFSANDTESTARLFAETGWKPEETTLLYHHRPDRRARLGDFLPWINDYPWKDRLFTRATRPFFSWNDPLPWDDTLDGSASFARWWKGRGQVFACGNVAGWPLDFLCTWEARR